MTSSKNDYEIEISNSAFFNEDNSSCASSIASKRGEDTTPKDPNSTSSLKSSTTFKYITSPFASLLTPRRTKRSSSSSSSSSKRGAGGGGSVGSKGGSVNGSSRSVLLREYNPPTHLHKICHDAASLYDLEKILSNDLLNRTDAFDQASVKDKKKQNPLHVLSRNTSLSSSIMNEQSNIFVNYEFNNHNSYLLERLKDFVTRFLLPLKKDLAKEEDIDKFIPFERSLHDWIDIIYFEEEEEEAATEYNVCQSKISVNQSKTNRDSTLGVSITSSPRRQFQAKNMDSTLAVGTLSKDSLIDVFLNETEVDAKSKNSDSTSRPENQNSSSGSLPDRIIVTMENGSSAKFSQSQLDKDKQFPFKVRMSAHAEVSLIMLSVMLDHFEAQVPDERQVMMNDLYQTENSLRRGAAAQDDESVNSIIPLKKTESETIIEFIVRKIASIPHLMKTLLLLKEEEKDRIFKYPIVQKAMMQKESIGVWLTIMLQHDRRDIKYQALSYLFMLSEVAETERSREDLVNRGKTNARSNNDALNDIVEAVSGLDGLLPSISTLNEKIVEELATTRIISRVLDKMITMSFVVSIVFCDAILILLLLSSFRVCVVRFVKDFNADSTLKWIYVGNAASFYFIIREIGKAVSLSTMLSHRRFWRKYFWGFWNLIDILSIVMVVLSNFTMRYQLGRRFDEDWARTCAAITTGLLWLRIVGLLKTINRHLATFVLAIAQITRDMMWYLIIIGASVVSFSQIIFVLIYPENCSTLDADDDRCNQKEYYLKVYNILLDGSGIQRDELNSDFAVTLFVLFSFMVLIILVNILIAITNDSYEKCLLRSKNLFGRARVMLLAELVSFQNLLYSFKKKRESNLTVCGFNCHISKGGFVFYCLSSVAFSGSVLLEYYFYNYAGKSYGNIWFSVTFIVINLVTLAILMLILRNNGEMSTSKKKKHNYIMHWDLLNIKSYWQNIMLRLLGGTHQNNASFEANGVDSFDAWKGRLSYLQEEMEKVTRESAEQIKNDVQTLESKINGKFHDDIYSLEKKMKESQIIMKIEALEAQNKFKKEIQESSSKLRKKMQQMDDRLKDTIEQSITRTINGKLQEDMHNLEMKMDLSQTNLLKEIHKLNSNLKEEMKQMKDRLEARM